MKKSISILLAVILVLSCSLAFAEEGSCSHSWSGWTTVKAASCTANGTERRICSECGAHEDRSISATGHSWSGWQTVKEPTCTATGTERRICSECGAHEDKAISATGHSWSSWQTVSTGNCSAEGTDRRICSECGAHEDRSNGKGDHVWSNWVTVNVATCAKAGLERRICSVCGKNEDRTVAALAHSWGNWVTMKAATCTTDGSARRICSECGIHEDKAIPATGHSWGNWTTTTAPTCTAEGVEKRSCTACDASETRAIAATGHTEVIDASVAATCTESGLTEGKHCSVCGTVLTAQTKIPAKGHQDKKVTVAPTFTRRGYDKYTCKVCGRVYKTNYTDKLVPTSTTAPVVETYGEFDSIVFDANDVEMKYTTQWDETVLTIVAAADADGAYSLRELHISFELIEQLKAKNIETICFVVGDATLTIPMSIFEDEALALVKADVAAASYYAFIVDPAAATENGYSVSMMIASEDEAIDVTGVVTGLTLSIAGVEQVVA